MIDINEVKNNQIRAIKNRIDLPGKFKTVEDIDTALKKESPKTLGLIINLLEMKVCE